MKRASSAKTDIYILAIGTNDLLPPYLATVSPLWNILMSLRVMLKKCLKDSSAFKCEYEKMIQTVSSRKNQILILGLPYLQLKDFPNDLIDERNQIIKELAIKYGIPFIDVVEIQHEINRNMTVSYSWNYSILLRLLEGTILPILPCLKDWLSDMRNLELTVDGVHWSSKVARAVAAAISANLS